MSNGLLKVDGSRIVDGKGNTVILRGVSLSVTNNAVEAYLPVRLPSEDG